jgi:hypothetical protein|tara:strand:- start:676 stop:999 length:324 start_codon:yes stop_codon:yes gene_type:complete
MNKTIKLKKRYNNMAEVRSYVFDEVKKKGYGLKFQYINSEGEIESTMTISHENLKKGFVTARGIKSKIVKGQVFDLISFYWKDDSEEQEETKKDEQLNIFDRLYSDQ